MMRTYEQLHQSVMELHHGLQVEGLHTLTDEQVRSLILDLDELHMRVASESARRNFAAKSMTQFNDALRVAKIYSRMGIMIHPRLLKWSVEALLVVAFALVYATFCMKGAIR